MNVNTSEALAWAAALLATIPSTTTGARAADAITEQQAYEIGVEA